MVVNLAAFAFESFNPLRDLEFRLEEFRVHAGLGAALSRGWRTCALVFAYAKLLLVFFGWLLFLQRSGPITYGVFGLQLGVVARGWLFATVAVAVALTLWELHVLTRPGVRRLFHADDEPASAPLQTDATRGANS